MLLGIFASCKNNSQNGDTTQETTSGKTEETTSATTESESASKSEATEPGESTEPGVTTESENKGGETTEPDSGSESENETTKPGNEETTKPSDDETTKEEESTSFVSNDMDVIELSSQLANGVSPYYADSNRNQLIISNLEMNLSYNMTKAHGDMLVSNISTKDGHDYIRNTMDVYVKMKDGNIYYAGKSASTNNVTLNIYRYGYYYYENRLEGQNFINAAPSSKSLDVDIRLNVNASHDIKVSGKITNGIKYVVEGSDPYVVLNGINYKTSDYDMIEVTIKVDECVNTSELYIIAGSGTWFSDSQKQMLGIVADGQPHTYQIPLSSIKDYTGNLKGLRFDITGAIGSEVEISNLKLCKLDYGSSPKDLTIQRSFVTYSNKLHHVLQVSAYEETDDIQAFGMLTQIDANTVEKLVVKDRNGLHYELSGIAWNTVEYVGFDIKDAGIFGFILPYDGSGGSIRVTLEDGVYRIEQNKAPVGGKVSPSSIYHPELEAQSGRYEVISTNNGNDFFMGQRIYTDENHTFDKFIYEAACERNPLTEKNFIIDTENSDNATFAGYNALYGYYKLTVSGTGFNNAYYKYPNRHYAIKFTMKGDEYNRNFYIVAYTTSGQLECAALLNYKEMMLPVSLEVAKNFAGDGENTIYNNEDKAYGETYFPMILGANQERGYTIINMYQNWGKVPLKQISSIQYHTPYYHLSTGVTETNCIVPFNVNGPGLPDFRAMSAPFWKSQPQHNSGGAHSFLGYTTSSGQGVVSDTTGVTIDSYGPTYADIAIDYMSSDGKISATYTHMEMPETDENRSYYEMKYTVLEDVSINDFRNNFTFYYCTDNNPDKNPNGPSVYEKIGYLDENNKYQVVDANHDSDTKGYVLGDECPYFSFFMMPNYWRENPHADGYTNIAFLIYNYEIIINGQKVEDANFYIRNKSNWIRLSLDLGDVELKKGDTFTINAILMPWGSQQYEDGITDLSTFPPNYEYTDVVGEDENGNPIYYMDKNVRDVRENTLLNPLKAIADKDCEIMESVFIPRIKTTNGKSAEFTVSGGYNNCSIRVYGFEKLTVPVLEEYKDGKWHVVELSSATSPDMYGYGNYYDGYGVHYDGDGKFSYSFVTDMTGVESKKFRLSATEDFTGWPEKPKDDSLIEDPIKYFLQPKEIMNMTSTNSSIAGVVITPDKSCVSLSGHTSSAETTMYFLNNTADRKVTGQYMVFKYRIPTGMDTLSNMEIFASTDPNKKAADGKEDGKVDRMQISLTQDDKWHVIIIDLADAIPEVELDKDGNCTLSFVRLDILNKKVSADMYIDIAYFGLHDNLEDIYKLELNKEAVPSETAKYVNLINSSKTVKIDPTTGNEYIPVYVDPNNDQGYKVSDVEYVAWIDYINRASNSFSMHNDKSVVEKVNPTKKTIGEGLLVLTGWCVAEGGVEKYVWSADGGKTWHDTVMYNGYNLIAANDDMITAFGTLKKYTDADGNVIVPSISDVAASKVNAGFQGGSGICADLANYYAAGEVLNVTFAAVPKADTTSLCIIGHITEVEVYIAPELAPSETVNLPLTPEAMYNKLTSKDTNFTFDSVTLPEEKLFMRLFAKANLGDQYGLIMNGNTQHTGQYLYIKYKIPTGMSTLNAFEIFTSTANAHFKSGDNFTVTGLIQDNDWHVVIIDVSLKLKATTFNKNDEGRYIAKYLRIDFFEQKAAEGMYIDIAAVGFADNLNVIYEEICYDMDYVHVVGATTNKIDPSTGVTYVPTYVSKDSGYTVSDVEYAAWIDYINRVASSSSAHNDKNVVEKSPTNGSTMDGTQLLSITGWAVAEGGIEKYVWSADGGKTWNDVVLYNMSALGNGSDAYFKSYGDIKTYTDPQTGEKIVPAIIDKEASKANCGFQGSGGIAADLSDYAGKKVNVTFAAVPKADTDSLCILLHVIGVNVPELN